MVSTLKPKPLSLLVNVRHEQAAVEMQRRKLLTARKKYPRLDIKDIRKPSDGESLRLFVLVKVPTQNKSLSLNAMLSGAHDCIVLLL